MDRLTANSQIQRLFEIDRYISVSPSKSPDGSQIATVLSPGQIDGPFHLTLLSPAGDILEEAPIAVRLVDAEVSNIGWSPDGRYLLVNHSIGNFTSDALVLPFQMLVRWEGGSVPINAYEGIGSNFTVDNAAPEAVPTQERRVFEPEKIWRR